MVTTTMAQWGTIPDIIGYGVAEQQTIMTVICETKGATFDGTDCDGALDESSVYVSKGLSDKDTSCIAVLSGPHILLARSGMLFVIRRVSRICLPKRTSPYDSCETYCPVNGVRFIILRALFVRRPQGAKRTSDTAPKCEGRCKLIEHVLFQVAPSFHVS